MRRTDGAQDLGGSPAGPFGRVPDEVSAEQAANSARAAALSVLASVKQAIGDLDRITAWVTVSGFVQAAPGYARTTAVINAFSELVVEVFGDEIGQHARRRSVSLHFLLDLPVVVAAELSVAFLG